MTLTAALPRSRNWSHANPDTRCHFQDGPKPCPAKLPKEFKASLHEKRPLRFPLYPRPITNSPPTGGLCPDFGKETP